MAEADILTLFGVKGRVALVTGGSSGIGLMIATGLVCNGAKVYITALASDEIQEAVDSLNALGAKSGGTAEGFSSDVSTKEGIDSIAKYIQQRETHLDILISNAGIRRDPPRACNVLTASLDDLQSSLWSSDPLDWDATFKVNTTAHYFLSVALLKHLVAAADLDLPGELKGRDVGRGVIVITSSCASMHNCTNVDLTSYAASKAATDHLVAMLASKFERSFCKLRTDGTLVVPSNMNPIGEEGNMFTSLFEKMPAKRAGKVEDIAGTVLYLCSQAGVSKLKTQSYLY